MGFASKWRALAVMQVSRFSHLLFGLFWCGLGTVIIRIAARLKRVPTYETIWGPNETLNQ